MDSNKKLTSTIHGYGTIGVTVFFSIADIYRFGDIIADIQTAGTDKEVAIRDLMYLHDKLVATISSNKNSVFNLKSDEDDKI